MAHIRVIILVFWLVCCVESVGVTLLMKRKDKVIPLGGVVQLCSWVSKREGRSYWEHTSEFKTLCVP